MAGAFLNPNTPAGRAAARALEKTLDMPRWATLRHGGRRSPPPKKKP